ncbi:MAG: proton-conducting transporter membrane subunit [Nitrospira sp.]
MELLLLALTILTPLAASLLIALSGPSSGERSAGFGIGAVTVSVLGSLAALYQTGHQEPIQVTVSMIPAGLSPTIVIDRLAAVMMVLIAGVSLVIHVYSQRYMHDDPGYVRFFALLSLLTFVLLNLVTSGHLLWLWIWWHAVTWLLRTLLSFNQASPAARQAGTTTLWVQGVGDLALLAAVAATYAAFGTFNLREVIGQLQLAASPPVLWHGTWAETSATGVITLLSVLAIMTKSAQFPVHIWLTGTIEAPTPVSAMLHAGIVNAGGFLVNRLAPLYGEAPSTLHLLFVIGAVTALIGATTMLTQPSIKRTLVYSTMGQMGYMVMECGLGAFALAIFHLCAHGLFKATLFLNSGSGIHKARTEFKLPDHETTDHRTPFSLATWGTGLAVTLVVPLLILLLVHGLVQIPLFEAQGTMIFLFFAWVTSSQAVFSLYRLHGVASWKVSAAMVLTLSFIGVTYLWAGEAFTHFLYPEPGQAAAYFLAAAWPQSLFEAVVGLSALLIIGVWGLLYAQAHGVRVLLPAWLETLQARAYVAFLNGLYVEDAWWARRHGPHRVRIPDPNRASASEAAP